MDRINVDELQLEDISFSDFNQLKKMSRVSEYRKIILLFYKSKKKLAKITTKSKKEANKISQGIKRLLDNDGSAYTVICRGNIVIIFHKKLIKSSGGK